MSRGFFRRRRKNSFEFRAQWNSVRLSERQKRNRLRDSDGLSHGRNRVELTDSIHLQELILPLRAAEMQTEENIGQPLTRRDEVVLGVYGVDEWTTATFLRENVRKGINTIVVDHSWMVPASWDMAAWLDSVGAQYNFMSKTRVVAKTSLVMMEIMRSNSGKLEIAFNGVREEIEKIVSGIDANFSRVGSTVEWMYSNDHSSITLPLSVKPCFDSFYPWLKKPVAEYIDDYLVSSASVLILIGPPGTGKTSFIKNLIQQSGGNAKVTYDEKVMRSDGIFASFIDDQSRFMIMEDADAFLQARQDGNTMMHRFLNVSDGLISTKDKKLVFSTNLPSTTDIDSALMRPGRCFDVLEFRPLTRKEAERVAVDVGRELPDDKESYMLAEIFNAQPSQTTYRKTKVGFI